MRFSEFLKRLGADPWNKDPEILRARNSAAEFETAAVEAEVFEEKLQSLLQVQPPDDLLDEIKAISKQPVRRRNLMPLALAASLLIAVGSIGLIWKKPNQWDTIDDYISDHYSLDGAAIIEQATGVVAEQEIIKILTGLNAVALQQLSSRIRFIKFCPTPAGLGAHMVVSTDQGLMTIFFMPKTQVTDGEMVRFGQMHAFLVNFEHGSVAIIGRPSQTFTKLESVLRNSLKTGLLDA